MNCNISVACALVSRYTGSRKRQKAKNMPKLGTKGHPAVVRVATQERAEEIVAICNANGWQVVIGLEPGKPEDISDIERLRNPPEPFRAEPTTGRNDPCPCGSGKKFKKCCGA
ncbi:MAG: SEC-C metal-binding domain-containing protein [Verrucomicrobia bacterium]|nr:SEC-C metal-binding domain-containing protein [Verrucomicrobiota bacterium]